MSFRFPIGTKYTTGGKHPRIATITGQHTTIDQDGNVVRERYVSVHEFLNRVIQETDIPDTTVARGLLPEFRHLLKA